MEQDANALIQTSIANRLLKIPARNKCFNQHTVLYADDLAFFSEGSHWSEKELNGFAVFNVVVLLAIS
ncbi:unnamed protein product [Clavelina lepadiformis]|uniref:Reverse transcriptase n=1 Tax=Clavelina lepadiformis TaxID=159417 RepID=A0ABP0FNC2_CLALP